MKHLIAAVSMRDGTEYHCVAAMDVEKSFCDVVAIWSPTPGETEGLYDRLEQTGQIAIIETKLLTGDYRPIGRAAQVVPDEEPNLDGPTAKRLIDGITFFGFFLMAATVYAGLSSPDRFAITAIIGVIVVEMVAMILAVAIVRINREEE
jgi:hypothetical protein